MISFSTLGKTGARLGNQLFQYAFLRTQAKRLGVKFYCPTWEGEKIFLLDDANEKSLDFSPVHVYHEDLYRHGFNTDALTIEDGTEITGYFQGWQFFNRDDIMKWFTFNEELFKVVALKYQSVDFTQAVAVHVRLGDYLQGSLMFYTPTPQYFKNALALLNGKGAILVFSEDVELVKKYLGEMPKNTIFVEGNKDYEDFYLMSLCKDIIISPSSFSWWAAYLNKNVDKRVVAPSRWYIPYSPVFNNDIFMDGWTRIKGHRILSDNYYYRYIAALVSRFFKYFACL